MVTASLKRLGLVWLDCLAPDPERGVKQILGAVVFKNLEKNGGHGFSIGQTLDVASRAPNSHSHEIPA